MALTKTDIANAALVKLGSSIPITSLEQGTREADVCKSAFGRCKLAVLRLHPWNFAIKRVSLSADATAPAFGYSYAFTLPSDFVRLVSFFEGPDEWRLENGKILADSDELDLRYVYDIGEDFRYADALFGEALATYLAHDICYSITQGLDVKDRLQRDLQMILSKARFVDAGEEPLPTLQATDWLDSRFGASTVYPERVLS